MKTAEGVDIVAPILHEAGCVDELIDRLARACPGASLIFVDNEGYSKSLRDGIAAGKGHAVVTIDADLEYSPESIPALLDALRSIK